MALHDDICDLFIEWDRFKFLFSSQKQVVLLDETASLFFRYIQRIMLNDVILHISRLTDKKDMGKNKNLTILCLPDLFDVPETKEKKEKIDCLCDAALKTVENIREVRHKLLAHSGKNIALKLSPAPGLKKYVKQVDDAIAAICEPLNKICQFSSEPSFCINSNSGIWDSAGGDVDRLIEVIKAGNVALKQVACSPKIKPV